MVVGEMMTSPACTVRDDARAQVVVQEDLLRESTAVRCCAPRALTPDVCPGDPHATGGRHIPRRSNRSDVAALALSRVRQRVSVP